VYSGIINSVSYVSFGDTNSKGRAALDHLRRSAARGKLWRHQLSIIRGRRRSSSLSDGVDSSGGELVKLYPARTQTTFYCVTQPAFCMHDQLQW